MEIEKKSWRHHYVQQFLLKGFLNEKNKLFVYDKIKDKILTETQSTKSVMFEVDRNTITFENGKQSSIIEDTLLNHIDNISSIIVKKFQSEKLPNHNLVTQENIAFFTFFVIDLFWRIPYSDSIVNHLIENLLLDKKNYNDLILNDAFRKQIRTILYKETLKYKENLKRKESEFSFNLFEVNNDIFVIGDNPIVYERKPDTFEELFDLDYCIAISSNRIVTSTMNDVDKFTEMEGLDYNLAVISQSTRFVCSGDRTILESSIDYYKNCKDLNLENEFRLNLFQRK
ncbi:DUF4238 domain-containing protein [Flavobacterium magnesitis]|uniref:DUF4238 domain-containing protein n=1 Tax=Flavobacterium magnesitis TaxID=3138077 RepID=UPI00358FD208